MLRHKNARRKRKASTVAAHTATGGGRASAPFPKFVIRRSTLCHELRKQRGTSKHMILVPLFDLKFLIEFAATGVGTSNRRHWLNRARRKRRYDQDHARDEGPAGQGAG